jgi:hypothetical protein
VLRGVPRLSRLNGRSQRALRGWGALWDVGVTRVTSRRCEEPTSYRRHRPRLISPSIGRYTKLVYRLAPLPLPSPKRHPHPPGFPVIERYTTLVYLCRTLVYRLVYQPLTQLAYPLVDCRPVLLEG